MAWRPNLHPILWFAGLPFLLLLVVFIDVFTLNRRPSDSYLLPVGFTGWTRLDYKVAGAPDLTTDGGRRLVRMGADGRMMTSDPLRTGYASDEYYYYAGTTRRRLEENMIWGRISGQANEGHTSFECFFVGSKQEYQAQLAKNPCR